MSLLLLAAMVAAEPGAPKGHWIRENVIATSDGKTIIARGKDGLEAIDAATGKTLWVTKGTGQPAGISGNHVFGWIGDAKKPNRFQIVVIDAAKGEQVVKSEAIAMPDWAVTANQGGRSFRTAASSDGDKLLVVWQANAFYFGGARPTPEIEEAARKTAVGVVSVDVKSGKATVLDRKPRPDEFGTFSNKAGDLEFQIEEELPALNGKFPLMTKVTLSAIKDGKAVWKRELAGNPWSPPPP